MQNIKPSTKPAPGKNKRPTLITGKKKIVSIDDLLGSDDETKTKPEKPKVGAKKSSSASKDQLPKQAKGPAPNSKAPVDSKKRKQPDTAPKKNQDEIDDIFGDMKAPKKPALPAKVAAAAATSKPARSSGDDDFWKDSRGMAQKRKVTADGLPVYSEDELKIGRGGDTPLCPFDCDCCF